MFIRNPLQLHLVGVCIKMAILRNYSVGTMFNYSYEKTFSNWFTEINLGFLRWVCWRDRTTLLCCEYSCCHFDELLCSVPVLNCLWMISDRVDGKFPSSTVDKVVYAQELQVNTGRRCQRGHLENHMRRRGRRGLPPAQTAATSRHFQ